MEREKLITLVTAAQSGDNGAMNELFNAFYNDVYYFALKTVKDEELACDVTQETFVEIIRTIGNLQEPAAFVKWMKQITYHQCTRYFKKKKDVLVDEDEDGNTLFDTVQEEKTDFIPDEALDQDEFKKTILLMLDELSEEQRAAVLMFYYDELSIKQIAEIQGVSENTVKSRLNYARKGIKKSVEDYEEKHGIKLHSIALLPLLHWVFKGYFSRPVPPATVGLVAEGVSAATGTTLAATAATTTAAAAATTTATTATAVGVGAKIAAIPLAAKIAAGVAAAVIAVGGGAAAVILSDENRGDTSHVHTYVEEVQQAATCTEEGSATYTCSCGDTYTAALLAAHQWGEWSQQGFREYRYCPVCTQNDERKAALDTEEQILLAYTDEISWLGYFSSVDKLSAMKVLEWCKMAVDPIETGEYEAIDPDTNESYTCKRTVYAVSDLDAHTLNTLGRVWDYSVLEGQSLRESRTLHYDAQANTVIEDFDTRYAGMGLNIGVPYYVSHKEVEDNRFEIIYDLDYQGDGVPDNVLVVERVGDKYIIVGNYAAEDIPDDIVDATTTATVGATTTATGDTTTGVATNSTTGVVIGSTADSTTTALVSSGTTTTAASGVDVPDNTIYTCDFENGLGNWAGNGDDSTIGIIKAADLPVANADGGTQALKFAYGMKYEYCVDKSAFVVEPDTTYQLTFDVLSNQPDCRIRAVVSVNSWLAEQIMNVNYYVAMDQWQTVSMTFTSGSDTNLYLGLQAMVPNATGIFYIDNIAITKVATP